MATKLTKFKTRPRYEDIVQKINALEAQYVELLGARENWDENLKKCFSEIRMGVLCKQFPAEEDLECQYEDKNSRNEMLD